MTVSFRIGEAATTTYAYGQGGDVVKDGVGRYHCVILASAAGLWHYGWRGTSPGQAAQERDFEVHVTHF